MAHSMGKSEQLEAWKQNRSAVVKRKQQCGLGLRDRCSGCTPSYATLRSALNCKQTFGCQMFQTKAPPACVAVLLLKPSLCCVKNHAVARDAAAAAALHLVPAAADALAASHRTGQQLPPPFVVLMMLKMTTTLMLLPQPAAGLPPRSSNNAHLRLHTPRIAPYSNDVI
jgi:hypothetical protein